MLASLVMLLPPSLVEVLRRLVLLVQMVRFVVPMVVCKLALDSRLRKFELAHTRMMDVKRLL